MTGSSGQEKLEAWAERFRSVDFEGQCGHKSYRIAIARKGPRLCELFNKKHENGVEFNNANVVSEHAIPFMFNDLDGLDRIKLADEAIYYGTTFVRIYTVLLTGLATIGNRILPKSEVKAVPALISNDKMHSWESKLTFDVNDLNSLFIDKNEIPKFINGLLEDFLQLHKPFDIEFPIFYLKVKPEYLEDAKTVRSFVCHLAGVDEDASNVYCNHHYVKGKDYYNISWLVSKEPYRNRNLVESDFIKFRFFPDKEKGRLAIICYAPHLFPDNFICEDSPLFTDEQIKSVWRKAWQGALSLQEKREDGRKGFKEEYRTLRDEYRPYLIADKYPEDDESNWIYQLEEYEYHRTRSFIIFANYLLSFQKAQDFSKAIQKAAKKIFQIEEDEFEFGLESSDLAYLVGNRLGKDFAQHLNACYDKKDIDGSFIWYMGVLKDFQVMPDKYITNYQQANHNIMAKCCNISELISVGFSNIHKHVELAGRRNEFENLDRLRFGESFSTLYHRAFAYFSGLPDLYCKIHQCMDFRIDNGSVVPKYVCQKNHPDKPWLRLFRSGENEDKVLEQQLRLFSIILYKLYTKFGRAYLAESKIALAFNLILNEKLFELGEQEKNQMGDTSDNLLFFHYRIDKNRLLRVPVIESEIEGVANRDVLSFCLDFGLLKLFNGGNSYILSDNEEFLTFKDKADFWGENLEEYVQKKIDCIFEAYKNIDDDYVEELLNWLYISDQQLNLIDEKLGTWIEDLEKKQTSDFIKLEDVGLFYKIYESFPVEYDMIAGEVNRELDKRFPEIWKKKLRDNAGYMLTPGLYTRLKEKGELMAEVVRKMVVYFFKTERQNSEDLNLTVSDLKQAYYKG